MTIIDPLQKLALEKVFPEIPNIPVKSDIFEVINLLIDINVIGDTANIELRESSLRFGYHILKEDEVVQALPTSTLHCLISKEDLRCDEGTVIKSIYIKYRQLLDTMNSLPDNLKQARVEEFLKLLDCANPMRLRLSDGTNEYWTDIYERMQETFGLKGLKRTCRVLHRGSQFREVLTIEPYQSINPMGECVGFKRHRKSGDGPEYNLSFSVSTRKALRHIWFGASIPKTHSLVGKDLKIIVRWVVDGYESNLYCSHSKDVVIDGNPNTRFHGESIRMDFDYIELLPDREYRIEASLRDITIIQGSHLNLITIETFY